MLIGFIFWYHGLAKGGIADVGQLQLLQPFFWINPGRYIISRTGEHWHVRGYCWRNSLCCRFKEICEVMVGRRMQRCCFPGKSNVINRHYKNGCSLPWSNRFLPKKAN
jgi:hypothetical protein